MLSTKLPGVKSSNPKQIPSQRTKRNEFWCPRTLRSRPPCFDSSSPFICIWIFVSAHSKRRVSVFVRRLLVARRMLNEQIRGREETSFVVPLFGNESSTNIRDRFSFVLLSFASLFSLFYLFLCNSMLSLAFFTCAPLPTKEKEGWWTSKNHFHTHITLNFTKIFIFHFFISPMCTYVFLTYLPPKIIYIQGKLRWKVWNYGVYHL